MLFERVCYLKNFVPSVISVHTEYVCKLDCEGFVDMHVNECVHSTII